ncbi:ABC transporter permease [Streptomyces sp. ME18-1-4]|jgi:ABC-2 type transport system permease protein|uniref:ABC transporter permease n=1 Tax=Streptomyces sp. ME18-1-4 TaxID=3028685 RepID=UPI0029AC5C74|nr:ABC transporter permease [Streptomyces sp. ME18-1-4]MDX3243796.1 ABC transporter permease [Streptomyces sp. ME18-1-4]
MLNALRYELIRIRTLRSTWILLAAGAALQFLVAYMAAGHHERPPLARFLTSFDTGTLPVVLLFPMAIVVGAFGHEYRYRTITTTVLTLKSRPLVMASKAVISALLAAVTGVLLVGVTLLAQVLRGGAPDDSARIGQALAAVVLYAVLSFLVGLGLAALTRNATVAMIVMLAVPTVGEGLLSNVLKEWWMQPFYSVVSLMDAVKWQSPLPLTALAALVVVGAGTALARRDV